MFNLHYSFISKWHLNDYLCLDQHKFIKAKKSRELFFPSVKKIILGSVICTVSPHKTNYVTCHLRDYSDVVTGRFHPQNLHANQTSQLILVVNKIVLLHISAAKQTNMFDFFYLCLTVGKKVC